MNKYRKKPVVIEAERWFHKHDVVEVNDYYVASNEERICCSECGLKLKKHGEIPTLEGRHIVCPGDWIITGVKGEKYPCKPDIFKLTYEAVK